jgi:glucose-6-phosphate 1-epimerase
MAILDLSQLNQQYGIPGQVRFSQPSENFAVIEVANSQAGATIALQGAHIMTWAPRKQRPVIWLSPAAKFATGKSIRGGVPICWPWFGPHGTDSKLPGHGYARTVPWEMIATRALSDGRTQLEFKLVESEASRKQWPHDTPVEMHITVGKRLTCVLRTRNAGSTPVTLGDALHTYFAVSDIRQIALHGLGNNPYIDKVDGGKRKQQQGPIAFTAETDRIYLESTADCLIDDPAWQRRIRVQKRGSASTVVWNPWHDKAVAMGDFGSDGFSRMVCVESANAADDVVKLAPGAEHRLWVEYSVEPL